ncbi:MAG: carboxypeptidase-like regulatory domain-containing protein [Fibrobacteria bacterium]
MALLSGLLLASCIPTRKEEDRAGSGTELGNVVGTIYTADNRPAVGITVTLYPDNPESASIKTAVTGAEGDYAFQGVTGAYSLYASDGAGNGLKVDSIKASSATPIDLERLSMSPLASVSGYVKVIGIRPWGSLEPKVSMYLSRSPYRLEIAPDTDFLWTDLAAGKYWLTITYSLAKSFTIPVTLLPGKTLDLDTVTLVNEYSTGLGGRDTLKVSSSQLPLTLNGKLGVNVEAVDSVVWALNGEKIAASQNDRYLNFTLEAGRLHDTGFNVLEMRLYLKDTTAFRTWYIDLDDSPVTLWAHHAVKAVFLASEDNPRQNTAGLKLGTFQILASRVLTQAEMAFWNWTAVPGGDTALPNLIKIPMFRFEYEIASRCGDLTYEMEPQLFPGDTVTFLTDTDEFSGGRTMRIRKDEDYADFANLAWFGGVSWPLADLHYGKLKGGTRDIRIGAEALKIKLERNYLAMSGNINCIPMSRGFTLGADGIPKEYVAMPAGMSSGNLLLHFRAGLPKGMFTDSLAASGDYVFLDSAGNGMAGSGIVRREVHLSASEVAELKALLASFPAVLPIEWNKDYLEDLSALPQNLKYLLSGGRGCILAGEPRANPVPEAKLNLFQSVEAWLRGRELL